MSRALGDGGPAPLRIAIIGSGSAAFAAAIRAAEGGAAVTIIESDELGGTCVNVGCVPSKIMIRAAHLAHLQHKHSFAGLDRHPIQVDRAAMVAQQQQRVSELRSAKYADVLKSNPAIQLIHGRAQFHDAQTLVVTQADGKQLEIAADRFLIATGRTPIVPGLSGLADTPFWTSTEALVAQQLPEHLIVLGGSVVALELGQAFLRLGSKVTLLSRSRLLPREDAQLGTAMKQILTDEGMHVITDCKVESVRHKNQQFEIETAHRRLYSDRLLVATGRRPNTSGLGLKNANVALDNSGAVMIDEHMRTNVANIFAAGDCTNQPQFVYVAAAAGTRAAINMLGGDMRLDLSRVPAVVFTDPQVATVGLCEKQAEQRGIDTASRTLSLENVPRALANFDTRGFIKIIAEKASGRLLGVQALAAEAGEIISAASLALRQGMTVDELAAEMFAYLTMAEGLKLCAQTFSKDVNKLSCCAG